MKKKYILNYMPLVFRLMLASISLFCLLPNLTAQQAQQQRAEQKTKQKPKRPKTKWLYALTSLHFFLFWRPIAYGASGKI